MSSFYVILLPIEFKLHLYHLPIVGIQILLNCSQKSYNWVKKISWSSPNLRDVIINETAMNYDRSIAYCIHSKHYIFRKRELIELFNINRIGTFIYPHVCNVICYYRSVRSVGLAKFHLLWSSRSLAYIVYNLMTGQIHQEVMYHWFISRNERK